MHVRADVNIFFRSFLLFRHHSCNKSLELNDFGAILLKWLHDQLFPFQRFQLLTEMEEQSQQSWLKQTS